MKWFQVKLKLKSWVASTWQSDTIFGHLCWGMRYNYGEDQLEDFLRQYGTGSPPLLLSNGFPGDLLPYPLMQLPEIDTSLSLVEQREKFQQNKKAKSARYLTTEEFTRAINGERVMPFAEFKPRERVTLKNQLSRLTSTTGGEGTLYNFEEYYWPEVTIYLKLADDFADEAKKLFQYIADSGYGKRKSVGYGQVELADFQPFAGFKSPAEPNGFVTLSNFVPAQNDPTSGAWKTIVKYGKMGEEYASGGHEFKKPLLMLEAGSTFYDSPYQEYYGRMVKGLNPQYPSVQYAFALPVPMILPPRSS